MRSVAIAFIYFFAFTSVALLPPAAQPTTEKVISKTEKADGTCFLQYTSAASECNESAGDDDAAFTICATKAKKSLKLCCRKNNGSSQCAKDAETK